MTTEEEQRYWQLEHERLLALANAAARRSYETWVALVEEHKDV